MWIPKDRGAIYATTQFELLDRVQEGRREYILEYPGCLIIDDSRIDLENKVLVISGAWDTKGICRAICAFGAWEAVADCG